MNRLRLILVALLLSCAFVFAEDNAAPSKKIGAREADKHYGESLTVTGKVAQVPIRPKVVFLNLDEAFPNSPFTGVIFAASTNQFNDLPKLKGKNVQITGMVKEYQNKPEIILTNASQLKVVEPQKQ